MAATERSGGLLSVARSVATPYEYVSKDEALDVSTTRATGAARTRASSSLYMSAWPTWFVASTISMPSTDSGSVDLVVFFNSLHHVPVAGIDRALAEAARVLRPGGQLYIAEPLAEGPQFDLSQPVNDETDVRRKAFEAIGRAGAHGLEARSETRYVADGKYAGYEAWRDNSIAIDPERAARFAAMDAELRRRFETLGDR